MLTLQSENVCNHSHIE